MYWPTLEEVLILFLTNACVANYLTKLFDIAHVSFIVFDAEFC